MEKSKFKSGFVALLGKPNVGKSTLINNVLGYKIAITSNRPQTTRFNIMGIKTTEESQIIFIDTPGLHKSKSRLQDVLMEHSKSSITDADIVSLLIDVSKGFDKADTLIYKRYIENVEKHKILLVNKIDLISRDELFEFLTKIEAMELKFDEVIPISASKGENLDAFERVILDNLPEGNMWFEKDRITTLPIKNMVSEIIREKILKQTREEVPHGVAVMVENMHPGDKNPTVTVVDATIYVDREQHKKIIIGKGGSKLKTIGELARKDLKEFYGMVAFLNLHVKVKKDWRDKEDFINNLGYRF